MSVAGAVVDYFAKIYRQDENNELKGRTYGVAFVCGFVTVAASLLSFLCAFQHNFAIAGSRGPFLILFRNYINIIILYNSVDLSEVSRNFLKNLRNSFRNGAVF